MQAQYIEKYLNDIKKYPLTVIIGLGIFLIAALGASVKNVASTVLAVWLIVSIFYINKWSSYWAGLFKEEKIVLIFFVLFTVSGLISYHNVTNEHEFIREMGRALRFTLIVPIYLVVRNLDKEAFNYLVTGVVASGPVFLAFALSSGPTNDLIPASGHYHHIVFGDIAILNAAIMTGYLMTAKTTTAQKTVIIASILCALYACLLSLTRGAWILIPVMALIYTIYAVKHKYISTAKLVLIIMMLVLTIAFVPQVREPILEKTLEARHEVVLFTEEGRHETSVGGRLALWHIATQVWKKHPIIGTGPGDFSNELISVKNKGEYQSLVVHGSAHSIYFHSMAMYGTLGVVIIVLALIVLPLILFIRLKNKNNHASALAGLIAIVAFAVFGLTESWILRAPMVSVYLGYFVICAASLSIKAKPQ